MERREEREMYPKRTLKVAPVRSKQIRYGKSPDLGSLIRTSVSRTADVNDMSALV